MPAYKHRDQLLHARWLYSKGGRGAALAASGLIKTRQLDRAIAELTAQSKVDMNRLKRFYVKNGKRIRQTTANYVAGSTGLPIQSALNRIRIRHAKSGLNPYVAISTALDASKIHTGRLRVQKVRGSVRKGRAGGLRIEGVGVFPHGFFYRPWKYKGKLRRVYNKVGERMKSINHPLEVDAVLRKYAWPQVKQTIKFAKAMVPHLRMRNARGGKFAMKGATMGATDKDLL